MPFSVPHSSSTDRACVRDGHALRCSFALLPEAASRRRECVPPPNEKPLLNEKLLVDVNPLLRASLVAETGSCMYNDIDSRHRGGGWLLFGWMHCEQLFLLLPLLLL